MNSRICHNFVSPADQRNGEMGVRFQLISVEMGVRFQLIHAACRPRWARPPLTAAELRRSLRIRPAMFAKLKHHFKAARPGGHFLSERPEKCAPMAGGASVPSEPACLDEAHGGRRRRDSKTACLQSHHVQPQFVSLPTACQC